MALENRDEGVGGVQGITKSFASLGTILPSFEGDLGPKVRTFFEQLEELAELYQWNDIEKLRVARCKLAGIAREFAYRGHKLKSITDYDEFKRIMIARFDTEPLSVRTQKFFQCIQGKDEDVQTYAVRLQGLAVGMSPEPAAATTDRERELIERCIEKELNLKLQLQFVSGLLPSIRRQVMSKNPQSFEEAITMATNEEMIERLMKPRYHISATDFEMADLRNEIQQLRSDLTAALRRETSNRDADRFMLSYVNNNSSFNSQDLNAASRTNIHCRENPNVTTSEHVTKLSANSQSNVPIGRRTQNSEWEKYSGPMRGQPKQVRFEQSRQTFVKSPYSSEFADDVSNRNRDTQPFINKEFNNSVQRKHFSSQQLSSRRQCEDAQAKNFASPRSEIFRPEIICFNCKNRGHLARDCKTRLYTFSNPYTDNNRVDTYSKNGVRSPVAPRNGRGQ